jgi:hypothetical protein
MYNLDAKTTKLSSRYSVKARQTSMFPDANVHPSTVSGRIFSHAWRQRGRRFFSIQLPDSSRRGQYNTSFRGLDEDAAQPNICWLSAFLTRLAEQGVSLWHIPPRSPDLNPVEKFWAWLRRELRRLDLQDLSKKKRPLSKSAYAVRVRSLCGSQKAQRVASNFAKGLKRVCNEVIAKKGAASSG